MTKYFWFKYKFRTMKTERRTFTPKVSLSILHEAAQKPLSESHTFRLRRVSSFQFPEPGTRHEPQETPYRVASGIS